MAKTERTRYTQLVKRSFHGEALEEGAFNLCVIRGGVQNKNPFNVMEGKWRVFCLHKVPYELR